MITYSLRHGFVINITFILWEKQVDAVLLLKTRHCADIMQELINNFAAILAKHKIRDEIVLISIL